VPVLIGGSQISAAGLGAIAASVNQNAGVVPARGGRGAAAEAAGSPGSAGAGAGPPLRAPVDACIVRLKRG
jgi:hypothetical protein